VRGPGRYSAWLWDDNVRCLSGLVVPCSGELTPERPDDLSVRKEFMTSKSRLIPYSGAVFGRMESKTSNDLSPNVSRSVFINDWAANIAFLNGYQFTDSQSHPEWRGHIRGRFTKDIGGPFTSRKRFAFSDIAEAIPLYGVQGSGANHTNVTEVSYLGPLFPIAPIPSLVGFPTFVGSTDSKLNQLGTDAIARCSPVNPTADAVTSLGEIVSDGLPKAVGGTLGNWRNLSNRSRRRAIGEEYLNVEFGWKPFVNDLKDLCKGVIEGNSIMEQLERNSGHLVRRRYDFPISVDENTTPLGGLRSVTYSPSSNVLSDIVNLNKGQVYRREITAKHQWFSGAFTYYIPPRDGSRRTEMARAVLKARSTIGVSLTPDTVWNLQPWSWLIDWFSNADSVLRNWSNWALYNQVLWYGYIMEHTVHQYQYIFTGPTGIKGLGSCPSLSTVAETKVRRAATPYGFGFSWSGLSTLQKSILAALGIARSK